MEAAQQPVTFEQVVALPSRPPDHVINYGSAPQQFGHLRLPKGDGPHPVVVFIHGGCYRSEYSIAHVGALEQALADLGYAVWSLEYRRVGDPGGGWPGTFQDVGAALDHLSKAAAQFSLDLQRIVVSGHSAGGNLALWLAGRHRIPVESPLHVGSPLPVRGVLALAPAGDLAEVHAKNGCGGMVDALMGGSPQAVPDRYRAASQIELLPHGVPQVLIIGGRDASFAEFGRSYHALALARGEQHIRAIEIADAGHFDVIAPTTEAWQTVTRALADLFAGISQ